MPSTTHVGQMHLELTLVQKRTVDWAKQECEFTMFTWRMQKDNSSESLVFTVTNRKKIKYIMEFTYTLVVKIP